MQWVSAVTLLRLSLSAPKLLGTAADHISNYHAEANGED
jgi:hypothetical protein